MHRKTALTGLCAAVALSGLLLAGCGKSYRQIVVVDGDKAELVTYGAAQNSSQELWAPGRTVAFRTDSAVPGGPSHAIGKAGRVYRVNKKMEMEEVDKFDTKVPSDTLAYRFGS